MRFPLLNFQHQRRQSSLYLCFLHCTCVAWDHSQHWRSTLLAPTAAFIRFEPLALGRCRYTVVPVWVSLRYFERVFWNFPESLHFLLRLVERTFLPKPRLLASYLETYASPLLSFTAPWAVFCQCSCGYSIASGLQALVLWPRKFLHHGCSISGSSVSMYWSLSCSYNANTVMNCSDSRIRFCFTLQEQCPMALAGCQNLARRLHVKILPLCQRNRCSLS